MSFVVGVLGAVYCDLEPSRHPEACSSCKQLSVATCDCLQLSRTVWDCSGSGLGIVRDWSGDDLRLV